MDGQHHAHFEMSVSHSTFAVGDLVEERPEAELLVLTMSIEDRIRKVAFACGYADLTDRETDCRCGSV